MKLLSLLFLSAGAHAACPPIPANPAPPAGAYRVIASPGAKAARAYVLAGKSRVEVGDCVVFGQNNELKATSLTVPKGAPCDCATGVRLVLKPGQYHCAAGKDAVGRVLLARCEAVK